jgi:hypothetical protein
MMKSGDFLMERLMDAGEKRNPPDGGLLHLHVPGNGDFGGYIIEKRRRLLLRETDVELTGFSIKYSKYRATL